MATKEWREKNKEKLKAAKALWYQSHKEEHKAQTKAWIEAHPEKRKMIVKRYHDSHNIPHRVSNGRVKARMRGHVFAVKTAEVMRALEVQKGLCAICEKPEQRRQHGVVQALAIDHCHATGRFRGLLCEACNKVLGFVEDKPERLQRMLEYLKQGQESNQPLYEMGLQLTKTG